MIDSETATKIAKEAVLGVKPTETSAESLAFRKLVEADIAKAKAAGHEVTLPFEVPES